MANSILLTLVVVFLTGCAQLGNQSNSGNQQEMVLSGNAWFPYDPATGKNLMYKSLMFQFRGKPATVALLAKTYRKLRIPSNDMTFAGKGVDKTVIRWPSNEEDNKIWTSDTLVFKNMTIVDPDFNFSYGKNPHIIFYNVKIEGDFKVRGKYVPKKKSKNPVQFTFFMTDFEKNPKIDHGELQFHIAFSRIKNASGEYEKISDSKFGSIALPKSKKAWMKADVAKTKSIGYTESYRQVIDTLSAEVKRKRLKKGNESDRLKKFVSLAQQSVKELKDRAFNEKDQAKAQKMFALSRTFKAEENYLLEAYSLARAKQLAEREVSGWAAAKKENRKSLEKAYGCQFTYQKLDRKRSEAADTRGALRSYKMRHNIGVDALRRMVEKNTPLLAKYSGPNSVCQFKLKLHADHFKGIDTGRRTLTKEPTYRETAASRARGRTRAMYAAAAREAAWDAAMARTNAAVNRMTSVTKQLHANRNRLETRGGATYLVVNKNKLRNEGYADSQKYLNAKSKAQQAKWASKYKQGDQEFEKDGGFNVTSSFYMSSKDTYQADLIATGFRGEQALVSAPPAIKTKSVGPCTRKQHTKGIGADISGPCFKSDGRGGGVYGYAMDYQMRVDYVNNHFEPVVLAFSADNLLKDLIGRIKTKSKSARDSDKLQARLLGLLLGAKSDGLKIDDLSQKVVGEPISVSRISTYLY